MAFLFHISNKLISQSVTDLFCVETSKINDYRDVTTRLATFSQQEIWHNFISFLELWNCHFFTFSNFSLWTGGWGTGAVGWVGEWMRWVRGAWHRFFVKIWTVHFLSLKIWTICVHIPYLTFHKYGQMVWNMDCPY